VERVSLPLVDELSRLAWPAELFTPRTDGSPLRCTACAHRCVFDGDRTGACGVRFTKDGVLFAPGGYVARRYARSVETNTLYHVKPGAKALTFGMYGCDLRCGYCHNWKLSQAIREGVEGETPVRTDARTLVDEAVAAGCEVVCAAYNEPLIAAEWVREVFTEAKARGLVTAVITDGHTTPEVLAYVRPVLDVFRVDLKGARAEQYKVLGGRREPVVEAIREAKRLGLWVEVVTLVVPGFADDPSDLRSIAKELVAIDPAIPWHLNAFVPRFKMTDRPRTPVAELVSAVGMGYARGLQYVYASNVARELTDLSHTRCASCREIVIERFDYATVASRLDGAACKSCGSVVPGIFTAAPPG
jgi:pyruvate formate lyase activating enzyme